MFRIKDFKLKKQKTEDLIEQNTDPVSTDLQDINFENQVSKSEADSGALYSTRLLSELRRQKINAPEDLDAVQPLLPLIEAKVKDREGALEAYEEWIKHPSTEEDVETPVLALDASAELFITSNKMAVFICVLPPIGEGVELTEKMITSILGLNKVTYGIDREQILQIAKGQIYNRVFNIARGTPPVHGIDGQVTEHFAREQEMHLEEDEKGVINYKNLNLYHSVHAGEPICDIMLPTDGQDGSDVFGHTLPAVKGQMPFVPKGEGTVLSADKTVLSAEIDGDLAFSNGVFEVRSQLVIRKDVDASTGHLDFEGDILIMGEIQNGFNVRAGGNVKVCGLVSGSEINAGGNIVLEKGANGGRNGSLIAGGTITAHYLEQINIIASGDVKSDTIINCNIACGGSIDATSQKGIIIGGILSVKESVEAKRIGNLSDIKTRIKLGVALENEDNVDYVEKHLKEAQITYDKIHKNVRFLKSLPAIPENKREVFNTLKEQEVLYKTEIDQLQQKLDFLYRQKPDFTTCHVKAEVIYGITEISLDGSVLLIQESTSKANVRYSDDGLTLGTF